MFHNAKRRGFFSLFILLLFPLALFGKERYVVARDPMWAPHNFKDKAHYINAFVESLFQQIALAEGTDFELIRGDFVYLFQGLTENWYQGVLAALNPNSETSGYFDFSDPFLLLGPVLIVKIDSKITSLSELDKRMVGISLFDRSVLIVQKYPSIIIKNYENMPMALEDLEQSKIDGVLLANLEAKYLLENGFGKKLKIVSGPLSNEALRLVALKGKEEMMIETFNRGLRKLQKNGIYNKLRKQFDLN